MHDVRLGSTTRGKPKLFVDGHGFVLDKEYTGGVFYWMCDRSYVKVNNRKKRVCAARLTTSLQNGTHVPHDFPAHDCDDANPLAHDINEYRNSIKSEYPCP